MATFNRPSLSVPAQHEPLGSVDEDIPNTVGYVPRQMVRGFKCARLSSRGPSSHSEHQANRTRDQQERWYNECYCGTEYPSSGCAQEQDSDSIGEETCSGGGYAQANVGRGMCEDTVVNCGASTCVLVPGPSDGRPPQRELELRSTPRRDLRTQDHGRITEDDTREQDACKGP